MRQFGEFVLNHWALWLALFVVIGLLVWNELKNRVLGFKEIKPVDAVALINRKDAIVVDVRPDEDYRQGHIVGAVSMPIGVLESRLRELEKYGDVPILVYCRTGQQSAHAAQLLRRHDFAEVYKISGGLMAWRQANMPVTAQAS